MFGSSMEHVPFPVSELCLALLSSAVLGRAAELGGSNASTFLILFQQPPNCYQGPESLAFKTCISHSSMTSNMRGALGPANSCAGFSAPISLGWDERDGICACILFYRSQVLNNSGGRRSVRNELQHYCLRKNATVPISQHKKWP